MYKREIPPFPPAVSVTNIHMRNIDDVYLKFRWIQGLDPLNPSQYIVRFGTRHFVTPWDFEPLLCYIWDVWPSLKFHTFRARPRNNLCLNQRHQLVSHQDQLLWSKQVHLLTPRWKTFHLLLMNPVEDHETDESVFMSPSGILPPVTVESTQFRFPKLVFLLPPTVAITFGINVWIMMYASYT